MAFAAIGLYFGTAFHRMSYPFELEWEEGSFLAAVQRIRAGQPLYGPPTLEHIPWAYTPGFYYVSAVACHAFGEVSLPHLRLVSFVASLGILLLIGLLCRHETGRWHDGLVAAGLFAATYEVSGAWFDLARVDSLFLFLLLSGACAAARGSDSFGWAVASGGLFAAALLTKQTALIAVVGVLGWLTCTQPRRGLTACGVTGLLFGITALFLNGVSNGWFWFYVYTLPRSHAVIWPNLWRFWTRDIACATPVLAFLATAFVVSAVRGQHRKAMFPVVLLAGLAIVSWGSRCHHGGYINTLMPVHAGLALASVYALARWRTCQAMRRTAYALIAFQMALLVYHPRALWPSPNSVEAGRAFVRALEEMPGEVFMPSSGYLATMAGRRAYAHTGQINDILRSGLDEVGEPLRQEMRESAQTHRFTALIFDHKAQLFLGDFFAACYQRVPEPVFREEGVFRPVTGVPSRPEWFLVPKGSDILSSNGK